MGLFGDIASGVTSIFGQDPNEVKNVPFSGISPEEQNYLAQQGALLGQSTDWLKTAFNNYNSQVPGIQAGINNAPLPSNNINQLFGDRTTAALNGQLPDDPYLTRQFQQGEQALRAQLQSQLGTGYETSTPGIQALADFQQRKRETMYGANQTQMNNAFQNYLAGTNQVFQNSMLRGSTLANLAQGQLPFVQTGGGLAGVYSSPFSALAGQQANLASTASRDYAANLGYRSQMLWGGGSQSGMSGMGSGIAALFG